MRPRSGFEAWFCKGSAKLTTARQVWDGAIHKTSFSTWAKKGGQVPVLRSKQFSPARAGTRFRAASTEVKLRERGWGLAAAIGSEKPGTELRLGVPPRRTATSGASPDQGVPGRAEGRKMEEILTGKQISTNPTERQCQEQVAAIEERSFLGPGQGRRALDSERGCGGFSRLEASRRGVHAPVSGIRGLPRLRVSR